MPRFEVEFIREETSVERYSVEVEAETAEAAQEKVRLHYLEGEPSLTAEEEHTETHEKCLGVEDSVVVQVWDAREIEQC